MPVIHQSIPAEEQETASSWLGDLWTFLNPKCRYGVRHSSHGVGGIGCEGCVNEFLENYRQHQAEQRARERAARVRELADAVKLALRELEAERRQAMETN